MKKGDLKVFYGAPVIQEELDEALEEALEGLGYTRYASGHDLTKGVRDLAFEPAVGNIYTPS